MGRAGPTRWDEAGPTRWDDKFVTRAEIFLHYKPGNAPFHTRRKLVTSPWEA